MHGRTPIYRQGIKKARKNGREFCFPRLFIFNFKRGKDTAFFQFVKSFLKKFFIKDRSTVNRQRTIVLAYAIGNVKFRNKKKKTLEEVFVFRNILKYQLHQNGKNAVAKNTSNPTITPDNIPNSHFLFLDLFSFCLNSSKEGIITSTRLSRSINSVI